MRKSLSFPHFGFLCRLVTGAFLLNILVLGVSLATLFSFFIAHAATGGANFSLQPAVYDPSNPITQSYFVFNGKQGTVVKSSIRVSNNGTAQGTVGLYPVDATTGQTSGTVFLNHNDQRRDVGAWVILSVQQLMLKPGQSQVVPFQVIIPNGVRSGQHVGGIVAENLAQQSSTQTKNNSTFQINVKTLTIVAVQVNLPGTPVEQLSAAGIQAGGTNGYQRLMIGLSNIGNVMLKPSGNLLVIDAQGHIVKNLSLRLDTFLPQTAINYPVSITGQALGAGDYQASLTLMYGHNQVLHYNTKFTITQQQLTQVFSSNKTQAPPGLLGGNSSWPSLWLFGIGGLVILLIAGNIFYWRFVVSRSKAKSAKTGLYQFKNPNMR